MKPCPWKKLNRFLFSTTIFGKVSHWKIVWHTEFFRESGFAFFCEIITSGAIFFFIFHVFCMAVLFFDIWKGNFIGVLFWQLLYKNQNCRNYLRFLKFIMWKLVVGVNFFQKFWEIVVVGVSLIFSKANQTRRTRFGFFF